ncbi:uncharacterized protein LOC131803890 isoform X8 [Musca domestica]|uniref:Uncharacterized protein LOC131803890 isoform X8 n=1 Tax=Musca domestica TaxID=7370 RepID=A0A1I8N0B7_MUSDO|nr:uncharacterized protein LOC131803890 isoform X8 [Musca domestica]
MPPKRRRRFQGLYYHSSPPKVLPMNGQLPNDSARRRRGSDDFSIKLSTIRIWMHEKEIGKLTRILWAGQGNRLRQQASTNPRVKRFLAAVPYVMNSIRDVHQAVIDNNLENLQAHLEPPVPPALVTCRDANGLNLIHKAAGLGHATILEYLITTWPDGVHECDITGKTPLHWAASAKNNMRCYTLLTQAGCDEEAVDYKMKTPSFYRHKPHEIERAFLTYVPEAPRVSPDVATDWEALSDDSGDGKNPNIKIPEMNGFGRHSNTESNENTSEAEMTEGASAADDDDAGGGDDEALTEEPEKEGEPAAEENGDGDAEPVADEEEEEEQAEEEKPAEDETEDKKVEENGEETESANEETQTNDDEAAAAAEDKEEPQDEETEAEAAADDGENDNDDEKENDEEGEEDEENEPNDEEDNENDVENDVDNNETDKDNENEAEKDDDNEEENAEAEPEDDGGADGTESPTSSMAIEGFVEGVADDNTVQSHKAAYVEDDNDEESRINRIIASGDMEQLAQIVLNGDGQKLLNVKAKESEIQAFLRNVPNYMDKIRRVHEAARGGSLLNLQQALDRRKFAIAKDEISPNGATPLHVAVLFGHSDIVRYLSARFPETTSVTDNDGRTALHYAAVISDNGHFYNVLQQLGANPKAMDNFDKTPEQYLADNDMKDTFNYGLLLKNFGAEELEEQLLSDQGKIENHSFEENPIFKTEQGKYLAENLADPLIKALTQVAQKRPQDPLQYLTNYLQTFVAQRNTNGRTVVQAAVHSGSSHTDSTALAANSQTDSLEEKPVIPTSRMNGHVTRDKGEDIGTDPAQQQIDDEDADEAEAALSKRLEERDEHGQSMLHFASARSHRRGGLLQLIEESNVDITYRDELYRTARDVALQANQVVNAKDIDRYLISLAIVGDVKPFEYFAIAGYDHIIDVMEDDRSIIEVAESKGHTELATYLRTIRPMEELREELHQMIRDHKVDRVKEIVAGPEAKWLLMARNYYGRTALHIAILKEDEELVEHFVKICPEALKIGDNLERSPLHYAMGTNLVEGISRILIQNGAKRTNKDLKGRQPSYYFMNKADILRLQEEEDENR